MNNKKLIRKINITLSIIGIFIFILDLTITKELLFEPIFIIGIAALLTFNVFRQLNQQLRKNNFINVVTNISILLLITFSLYYLLILSFGIGFTGRRYPLIMTIFLLYNLTFIPFILYDYKNKEREIL